jgi:hypothetical protein
LGQPDFVDLTGLSDTDRAEVIDLVARLHRNEESGSRDWEVAAAESLSGRLADIESDDDPVERQAWLDAFARNARPCRYVPGQGFVPA